MLFFSSKFYPLCSLGLKKPFSMESLDEFLNFNIISNASNKQQIIK